MGMEFRLPELGENIESGDVVKILVSVGDTVTKDQPVMEIETEKANIEVPSPVSGTIKEILVKEGEKVNIGQLLLTIDEGTKEKEEKEKLIDKAAPKEQQGEIVEFSRSAKATTESKPSRGFAPAAPSVRRLAREIGIAISEVPGSGPGGRISEEDVKNYARQLLTETSSIRSTGQLEISPLPDFTRWGEVDRSPMTNVRRKTAEHLSSAWTAPHETQQDKADITDLEKLRKQVGKK